MKLGFPLNANGVVQAVAVFPRVFYVYLNIWMDLPNWTY